MGSHHVTDRPKRVLFVCLGNICRSPAAEGVFQHLVEQQGRSADFIIDSAGTSGYHIGELADSRMRKAASKRGIELQSRSRMVTPRDFSDFDVLIAMDRANYRELAQMSSGSDGKIKLLSEYLADDGWPTEVPDPYYGGDEGFEMVLNMLQAAAPQILASFSPDGAE